jgi:hypothetical protein
MARCGKSKAMDHAHMNEIERSAGIQPSNSARFHALQEQITELKKRWPAHSTPPNMMLLLDELEEELENLTHIKP